MDVTFAGDAQRLLVLAIELSSADSSDEVAAILEAAAAPPGGYAQKYKRSMYSITSFVGISAFLDTADTGDPAVDDALETGLSLYAVGAVGIQYTRPGACSTYWGVFLSIVDVGALVRLSVTDLPEQQLAGETSTVEEVERNDIGIAEIFSPGLFFTLGLGESPVVFGIGGSLTPSLHTVKITDTSGETSFSDAAALRLGAFLAVDVTLWGF